MLGLSPIARNMICSHNPTFIIATNPPRVPERLFPGRCDLWGHSHQVPFRVTNTFLVTIWSISNEIVMLSVRNSTLLIYQYFLTNSSLAKIYWQRDKIPIGFLYFFPNLLLVRFSTSWLWLELWLIWRWQIFLPFFPCCHFLPCGELLLNICRIVQTSTLSRVWQWWQITACTRDPALQLNRSQ